MLKRRSTALTSMPFGKWKNVPIEQVEYDYLIWVIDNFDSSQNPDVYEMCENELIKRKNKGVYEN